MCQGTKLNMKIFVIILSLCGICYGSSKQWQLDVNFNNPSNWKSGKTPCATNKIIFPEQVNAVLFQTNISSVKEVVLPKTGQIFFPSDMILSFSDDNAADPNCDGGDATFVRTNTESWFDPDNWQDLDNLVSVETERVPCQYDSVVFPDGKVFNVGLDRSVTIGSMSFAGKDYTTTQFNTFLRSDVGKLQFTPTSNAAVTIRGSTCASTSGCPCGNDGAALLAKICNQYQCLPTSCSDPVSAVGGCCALCGAILTMEYDSAKFDLATFKKRIHDDYHVHDSPAAQGSRKRRELDTGEVDTYTSKTSRNQIQMVLTDKEVGSNSGQTAITLAQQIMADMQSDPGSFGIASVSIQYSTKGTGTQTGGIQGGAVAGIVIAVIIVIVVVITLAFYVRRRRFFFFSKDAPLHADTEIAPGIPGAFMEDIPGAPPAMYMQSFDNPVYSVPSATENLYDDPTRMQGAVAAIEDLDDLKGSKKGKGLPPSVEGLGQKDGGVGFDNPNYASTMETGIDNVQGANELDGTKGVDLAKQESES